MGLLNSSRCNNHISAQRGFCALEKGHTDPCAVMPRVKEQGIETPIKRVLIKAVPAHYIKVPQVKDTLVKCLGVVGGRQQWVWSDAACLLSGIYPDSLVH